VSNANDLLGLFDADFGILVIGEGAKILGPNQHGQEILIMAEYLRLKQYEYVVQISNLHGSFLNLSLAVLSKHLKRWSRTILTFTCLQVCP